MLLRYYETHYKKNISISPSNINLIIGKCSGDRETLTNELQKIEYFSKNGKKINNEIAYGISKPRERKKA